jgi:hypothetical protein
MNRKIQRAGTGVDWLGKFSIAGKHLFKKVFPQKKCRLSPALFLSI